MGFRFVTAGAAALFLFLFFSAGAAYAVVLPAQQDITPPSLVSVSFEPAQVDTSNGPATITVTVHITDDLSGASGIAMFFRRPGTTQVAQAEVRTDSWSKNVSGNALDGIYQATMVIPQYSAYGQWEMYNAVLQDRVGNRVDPWKTDDDALRDEYHWPKSYDSFVFVVGPSAEPPTDRHLFLPALSSF